MSSYFFRKTDAGFSGFRTPGWAAASGAVGVLVAVVGAWALYETIDGASVAPTIVAVAMVVLGVLAVVGTNRLARRRIEIDATGIRAERERGRWEEIRWDEPHAYHSHRTALTQGGKVTRVVETAWVATEDGRRIELRDAFRAAATDAATTFACDRSTEHTLAWLRRTWDAGTELAFGPVRLTGRRVVVGPHVIESVGVVATVAVRNGELFVDTADTRTPTGVRAVDVPNLRCLLELLR